MPLPAGIDLSLLKEGLLLALEYGDNLPPGNDAKILQALHVLSKTRLNETEARGAATRLATVTVSMLRWDDMPGDAKRTLRRALSNAGDHSFRAG